MQCQKGLKTQLKPLTLTDTECRTTRMFLTSPKTILSTRQQRSGFLVKFVNSLYYSKPKSSTRFQISVTLKSINKQCCLNTHRDQLKGYSPMSPMYRLQTTEHLLALAGVTVHRSPGLRCGCCCIYIATRRRYYLSVAGWLYRGLDLAMQHSLSQEYQQQQCYPEQ